MAVSKDETMTWEYMQTIENDPAGSFCYPAVHFIGKNILLTYWNRADKNNSSSDIRVIRIRDLYVR
jgi:hypothetical protein